MDLWCLPAVPNPRHFIPLRSHYPQQNSQENHAAWVHKAHASWHSLSNTLTCVHKHFSLLSPSPASAETFVPIPQILLFIFPSTNARRSWAHTFGSQKQPETQRLFLDSALQPLLPWYRANTCLKDKREKWVFQKAIPPHRFNCLVSKTGCSK